MVLAEYVMEPDLRLSTIRTRIAPCEDGIGLAGNETPVDGAHVIGLQQRHYLLESTTACPGHIFSVDHRTAVRLESVDCLLLVLFATGIVVIGDDVGFLELDLIEVRKGVFPYAGRKGL